MGNIDYSKMSREELIEALASKQVSKSVAKAKAKTSSLGQVFKNVNLVLGTWEHVNLPGYKVRVNKINQFDKRSMTVLLNVVDEAGLRVPRILFGDTGPKKGEDVRNVALPTVLQYLKLTPKAKKHMMRIAEVLVLVNNQAAETEGCGKGYATTTRFEEHLAAVVKTLKEQGRDDLLEELVQF